MAKRRPSEDFEIPFVALMDTMTNVVGVLIIVLVLVGLGVASAVKKILSDLPPVEEKVLAALKEIVSKQEPVLDPEELQEQIEKLEEEQKKAEEATKSMDLTLVKQKLAEIENIQKQIEEKKKLRDERKAAAEKLLAELEALKARLDQTPVIKPAPSAIVRLPNPRAYPAEPVESKILVTAKGVLAYRDTVLVDTILESIQRQKSRFEFRDGRPENFGKAVTEQVKDANLARTAWPEINPLASRFQYWQLGAAYKSLHDAGVKPSRAMLEAMGDLAVGLNKPLPDVASAVAAVIKGDTKLWLALDPARPPRDPLLKANILGNKVTLSYSTSTVEGRSTPDGIAAAFRDLSDVNAFKGKSKDRQMYDAKSLREFILGELRRDSQGSRFDATASVSAEDGFLSITLTPKPEFVEPLQVFSRPESVYSRVLKSTRSDPNGVIIFRVTKEGFAGYHEARRISEDLGVPATWEFAASQDLILRIRGYETQLTTKAATRPAPKGTDITIPPPKRTLD